MLDAGALVHLASLDEKLWLALACPTHGLELDARTLDLIDTDKDGRIRPPEVLAAVAWAKDVFADLDDLFEPLVGDELPLDAFDDETPLGRQVLAGARRILINLGRPDATSIGLAQVMDTESLFARTTLNGDGVVPLRAAAGRDDVRQVLADILAVMGAVQDRSGDPGVDKAKADAFFEQADAVASWLESADPAIHVVGDATLPAANAVLAVSAKVDDYFMRTRLAAYREGLAAPLDASTEAAAALAGRDLPVDDQEVEKWPLAHVVAGAPLPLSRGLNPAWGGRIDAFARLTVTPLLGGGREALTLGEWTTLKERLAPYLAWASRKPVLPIATLANDRVRELARSDARQKVATLIADDAALEAENSQIEAVEKAIRFRRDLVTLLKNFLSFADFYGKRLGIFQVGKLYIDGRSCDLCLPVQDVAKHASLAGLAKAYLVYCDCTRKGKEKRIIVAAVTAGHVDNLLVGRNGVFYDRKGEDWDATITRIVENPISVRQAFLSPYKRFVRLIEEQVAKRASAADEKSSAALAGHASAVTGADAEKAAPAAAAAPQPKKVDIGTVAAIGVAVGGIATFLSSVIATFLGLGMWMPLGLVGLLLAISGPSMVIAWLKLSQRNIGPILDANGWAVNAFARINVPFGGALTRVATLPKGATRILDDPFAENAPPYRRVVTSLLLVLLLLAWTMGKFDAVLPPPVRSDAVLHMPFAR